MSSRHEQNEPSSRYEDRIIEGHEYDGIKEYDNPMPGWWLWIFYATIAWSIFYVAALGVGWIDDYDAQLEKGITRVAEMRTVAEAGFVPVGEEALTAALQDQEAIATGQSVYARSCAACHGADLSGGIGPALNDGNWIHGESPKEIYTVILEGVPAKGMPAHGHLSEEQLIGLVAYLKTQ